MLRLYTYLYKEAERQGFEPWEQLPVHRISSAARSTTPASFLTSLVVPWLGQRRCKYMNFYLSLFSNIRFFQTMGAKEDSAPPPKPRRASENSSLRANFRDF